MSNLRRLLQQLRQEVEKITDEAPAGPGELDVSKLSDDELRRLVQLLARAGSDEPRQETRPRAAVLAGMGEWSRATRERAWAAGLGTPPPEKAGTGCLSDEERAELNDLLAKATVPEEWEGEEG